MGIPEAGMAIALALGTGAPIVINRSLEMAGMARDVPFLVMSALVFGAVGVLSARLVRAPLSWVAIFIFGGIALGMAADSALDQLFFVKARHPIQLEIAAMWTIALVPVAGGLMFGQRLRGPH